MEIQTDSPYSESTDTRNLVVATAAESNAADLLTRIRKILAVIVETMHAHNVDIVEMTYAGSGDSESEFSVTPQFGGAFCWTESHHSAQKEIEGSFCELCRELQNLVLQKHGKQSYEHGDGGAGEISVSADGELTLDHRDYYTESNSMRDSISLVANQPAHESDSAEPQSIESNTSTESGQLLGREMRNMVPVYLAQLLASSLSGLMQQLEGVGIALTDCAEGQWQGTEGLDFSQVYSALAAAKASHLLP